jgi:hypothetical protein
MQQRWARKSAHCRGRLRPLPLEGPQRPPPLSRMGRSLERGQVDDARHAAVLQEQHGVEVLLAHSRPDMQMGDEGSGVALPRQAHRLALRHHRPFAHVDPGEPGVGGADAVLVIDREVKAAPDPPGEGDRPVLGRHEDGAERRPDVDPPMTGGVRIRRRLESAQHWPGHRPLIRPVRGPHAGLGSARQARGRRRADQDKSRHRKDGRDVRDGCHVPSRHPRSARFDGTPDGGPRQ